MDFSTITARDPLSILRESLLLQEAERRLLARIVDYRVALVASTTSEGFNLASKCVDEACSLLLPWAADDKAPKVEDMNDEQLRSMYDRTIQAVKERRERLLKKRQAEKQAETDG